MSKANTNFLERKIPQGYQDKLDDSLLDFYCLVRGSQNVLINDEGKVVKRKGYTLFGQSGAVSQGVKSSKTWKTSSNSEITLRSIYDALQVMYNGQYRTILSGFKTNSKFRYDFWWDRTEGKDKLLMVNGETTIKSWSGGMTELASWTSTTISKKYAKQSSITDPFIFDATNKTLTQSDTDFITLGFTEGAKISVTGSASNNGIFTIKTVTASVITVVDTDVFVNETISNSNCVVGIVGRESWKSERFVASGVKQIKIGANTYTYTGGETTPTLTLTADPSADCSAGLFVYQAIQTATPSGTDYPVGFPIDIISVNINQAYLGSSLFRNVFLTKTSSYTDVNYSATIRKANEGGTINLDSNLVGIATSKQITYITAGDSDVYTVEFEAFSDGVNAGEIIKVKKLETAYGQGAETHEAFVKAKNGIIYLSKEPTIDFLGNIEQVQGQSAKPISDPIKRFLNIIDRTDAVGIYGQNYIIFLFPNASCILMYDLNRGFWQPPLNISASSICMYGGRILVHSASKDETYTLFSGLTDDGNVISAKVLTNAETLGTRSERKTYDEVFVEAFVNQDTKSLMGQIRLGYKGATNVQNIQLGYDDDPRFIEEPASPSGIGTSPFGSLPFGTLIPSSQDDPELGNLRLVHKIFGTDIQEAFTQQAQFINEEEDAYFELVCWGTNAKLSTTTNIDIKE